MNILYVSDSTTLSGAEVVMLQHVKHFAPPGHVRQVFLSAHNPRLRGALDERGVPAHATGAYSQRIIQTTLNPAALTHFVRAFAEVSGEMATIIRRERIDLVHSISYPASLYAAMAVKRAPAAHVWHEHNIKRLHAFNAPIYRWVARTCAAVLGPSDAVTQNLATAGIPGQTLKTLYNGIDLGRFTADAGQRAATRASLGIAPGEAAVALFGQLLPYKGHRTLIDAVERLRPTHPHLRAFIVGALENPPYEQELRSLIEARQLGACVSFTGWRPDVAQVMSAMDANVVATTTPEPAALALMETMAVGRPLVASRTGGTAELVVDGVTGLLFEAGDAGALAACLARILGDPALAARLGEAGRARVEARYTEAHHLAALEAIYADALRARTAAS